MQGEIVIPNRKDLEKMTEEDGQNMAVQIRDELNKQGMGASYVAEKIVFLIDNCFIVNNQGYKYLDAKTFLETLKFITKLHGVKITESGTVQVAIFNNASSAKDGKGKISF